MSKGRAAKLLVLVGFAALALAVAAYRRWSGPPQVGSPAPDFTLPALRGESLRLRDYRGQVVVLNFWATWCPPCVEEMPSLQSFADEMIGMGVAVISVSVDADLNALEQFATQYKLTFPVGRDPDQAVAKRYGTYMFPETYILDEDGRIADKLIGAVDWQDPRINEFVLNLARFQVR